MRYAIAMVMLLISVATAQMIPTDLQEAMDARAAAQLARDAERWGHYTTDDFLVVLVDGSVRTKMQSMAELKKMPVATTPARSVDQKYRIYGDTVIDTRIRDLNTGPRRFTTVWVKQSGRWRVATVHETDVRASR